jgi:hypothetical protein
VKTILFGIFVSMVAMAAHAADRAGPAVRQGGLVGELRTFIASSLSSNGTLLFTAPGTGYFVINEICANTTKSNDREIDVRVFAGSLHLATLFEPEGGAQPKCVYFPSGMVVPAGAQVKCEGGSSHECWVTGVCSRDCDLP